MFFSIFQIAKWFFSPTDSALSPCSQRLNNRKVGQAPGQMAKFATIQPMKLDCDEPDEDMEQE